MARNTSIDLAGTIDTTSTTTTTTVSTNPVYKLLDIDNDIKVGTTKNKTFPMWSDVSTDLDQLDESTITSFYTSSADYSSSFDSNYYLNIYSQDVNTYADTLPQFSIAFGTTGSLELSGSTDSTRYTYPATATYKQFANLLLPTGTNYFKINGAVTPNIYAISITRARLKNKIDVGTWQLTLSGSLTGTSFVNLVDDAFQIGTDKNDVYNIITWQLDENIFPGLQMADAKSPILVDTSAVTIGTFYAKYGILILDANKVNFYTDTNISSYMTTTEINTKGILQIFYNMMNRGKFFRARSVEEVQSTYYFINVKNKEFNFSNNPTWVTGSDNRVLDDFFDEPRTYITGIGLYDTVGSLVAVAKLSKPVMKDPESELSVQIRLDF